MKDKEIIIFRYVDEANIPRVWGEGKNEEQAKKQCDLALEEYFKSKGKISYYYRRKKYTLQRVGI